MAVEFSNQQARAKKLALPTSPNTLTSHIPQAIGDTADTNVVEKLQHTSQASNAASLTDQHQPGLLTKWAWLPVPFFLVLVAVLWVMHLPGSYDSPLLVMTLNGIFSTITSALIALLVARSYMVQSTPSLLLLGCGVIIWGCAGFVSNAVSDDFNVNVTIHNICVWLSALCHLSGVLVSLKLKQTLNRANFWLATAYGMAIGIVALVGAAAVYGHTPIFFVQGQGGTPVRHFVLISAITMFGLTALILSTTNREQRSSFTYWYSLAMVLIAVGLFGVMVQSSRGSLLGWAGRSCQFLSGTYIFMAAISSRRASGYGITFELSFNEARYRYCVAITLVLAAIALRLFLFPVLGTRIIFMTFYPAVMLAALFGGFRAGLLATLLSALTANYFWIGPLGFTVGDQGDWLALAIFVVSCAMISGITEAMHRTRTRAIKAETEVSMIKERQLAAEDLRQSEERQRLTLESSATGTFEIDLQTGKGQWNTIEFELLGIKPGSAVACPETFFSYVHPLDIGPLREHWESALRNGRLETEFRIIRADGQERWLAGKGTFIFKTVTGANGFESVQPVRFLGINFDITERKQVEEAMRESERRYSSLFANKINGMAHCRIIIDERGTPVDYIILEVNEAYERIVGINKADIEGRRATEVFPEIKNLALDYIGMYGRIALEGSEIKFEENFEPINRCLSIYAYSPKRGEFVAIFTDITDRKRAEEALAAAHRQTQSLIDNMPAIVYAFDLDERFVIANAALAELLKSTPQQMIGKRRHEFMPGGDADWHEANDRKVIEAGRPMEFEEHSQLNGRSITWLTTKFPLRDAQGKIYMLAGISADISARKQAEMALKELNEQLEQRVAEGTAIAEGRANQLRALAAELTIAEQREKKKLAHLLHDHLQQLLAAAKLKSSMLKSAVTDQTIANSIDEITDLLKQSIQCSRDLSIELSPPALNEAGLTSGLNWLVTWFADKHSLIINFKSRPEIKNELPEEIKHFVFNAAREMLFNVVKHAKVTTATLKLTCKAGLLYLAVSDEGAGIDAEKIKSKGTGFGLFSIKERIELLGGELKINGKPGNGTTVLIEIPVDFAETAVRNETKAPKLAKHEKDLFNSKRKKIRVLLADDHHIVRAGLSAMLRQQQDIEVIGQASDGEEAVRLVKEHGPDVVVLDVNMPKLNGIDAAKLIAKHFPETNVIGLSMHATADIEFAMKSAGAVAYYTKDGPPEVLIDAIRSAVKLN